ncbi:hypothetical protein 8014-B2_0050 [Lactobacillus phage ATCC 8014-B2]|uniref:Uncharacterized protein n=1 Tax=Lactobacillus phage ATCC 8014-B2 TaxID=1225795 RepID=K4I1Z3_9CAUD|nr:hypothetical protein HOQ89_gp096 [Lactobacillus phage ATCC 8014-B2]AFU63117.1 hypothetical protein 8014-B2_0050 [Lactobacillus phage ATCC 8014-B2]
MSLEIKLSTSWWIVNNEHSSSGVILEHRTKSKSSSKIHIDRTYHGGLAHALRYYAKNVVAKNDKKVKSVREYIDEYDKIFEDGVDKVEEAQQYFETDVTPKKNSNEKQ